MSALQLLSCLIDRQCAVAQKRCRFLSNLGTLSRMQKKILMVCLGNICRSPMAEVIFSHLARQRGLDLKVHSAGTNRYHKGGPADLRAIAECERRGLDLRSHVARRVVAEDFSQYDVLFSMARDVTVEIAQFAPKAELMSKVTPFLVSGQDVPDPWYGDDSDFSRCFDLLLEASEKRLDELAPAPKMRPERSDP